MRRERWGRTSGNGYQPDLNWECCSSWWSLGHYKTTHVFDCFFLGFPKIGEKNKTHFLTHLCWCLAMELVLCTIVLVKVIFVVSSVDHTVVIYKLYVCLNVDKGTIQLSIFGANKMLYCFNRMNRFHGGQQTKLDRTETTVDHCWLLL